MQGRGGKNKSGKLATSKPFCDCQYCECKNCPDVLQKLAQTNRNKTGFLPSGAKNKKSTSQDKRVPQPPHKPSILDCLNPARTCDCETMARVIRSHLHMNMGMTEQRSRRSEQRPSNSKDVD